MVINDAEFEFKLQQAYERGRAEAVQAGPPTALQGNAPPVNSEISKAIEAIIGKLLLERNEPLIKACKNLQMALDHASQCLAEVLKLNGSQT